MEALVNNNELPSVRRSCGDCVYCSSRWYDDGWLFDIPEQPHRLLRLICLFPYLIKRKIKAYMSERQTKALFFDCNK